MGHLIGRLVSGWVGMASTVLCQDYDANVNLKCMTLYCELQLSSSKRIAQYCVVECAMGWRSNYSIRGQSNQ